MESRWHMHNLKKRIMVEAPKTKEGKKRLEHFRAFNPNDWKGARIISVLQAYPSKIAVYRVHKMTN